MSYDGPRNSDDLWKAEDGRFKLVVSVKVQRNRLMRCRPKFEGWSADAYGHLDTNVLNFDQLKQVADTAGDLVGMGDWRPRYGRYRATLEASTQKAAGG